MPVITIDAPVGGINAFDSPEDMPATDAIALDNWICRSGYLESRPPIEVHADVAVADLRTLITYHKDDGTEQLICHSADTDTFYDVTTTTPSAFAGTFGGTATYWQHMEINGVLVLVCGGDNEIAFDGTTFTDLVYTGSSPAITAGEFVNCCNFKGRGFYTKDDVNSFWYAEAGSYQGVLTEFPLDSITQHGGYPVVIESWTMDTGVGPDDTLVIVQSTGEVLLYQGDDPGDPDNWEIIGRFQMPKPAGPRGVVTYGSDLIIITQNGFVNMVDVLRVDQRSDPPAFSRKIWPMIQDYMDANGSVGPNNNANNAIAWNGLILFGVTSSEIDTDPRYVFVVNTQTGGWSRFTSQFVEYFGQFAVFNNELYFTYESSPFDPPQLGTVRKFSTFATADEEIRMSAIPAFSNLGDPNRKKHITAVQFNTNHPDVSLLQATGYSEFNLPGNIAVALAYTGGGAPNENVVGGFPIVRKAMVHTTTGGWKNLHAYGFNVSMAVSMATLDRTLYWRQYSYQVRSVGTQ